jgi:hypothetical protein
LLLKFKSLLTTGSMGVVVLPKKACEMEASERLAGSAGIVVLMKVPGESRSGVGGFHAGDLSGDLHGFRNCAGLQGDGYARGFGHPDFDFFGFGFAETGFVNCHGVCPGGQERGDKVAVGIGGKFPDCQVGACVYDLYFSAADGCSAVSTAEPEMAPEAPPCP